MDNDFGDEYEYDDEDFEQADDDNKDNIFENSRSKEAKGAAEEKKSAPVVQEAAHKKEPAKTEQPK